MPLQQGFVIVDCRSCPQCPEESNHLRTFHGHMGQMYHLLLPRNTRLSADFNGKSADQTSVFETIQSLGHRLLVASWNFGIIGKVLDLFEIAHMSADQDWCLFNDAARVLNGGQHLIFSDTLRMTLGSSLALRLSARCRCLGGRRAGLKTCERNW